MAHKKTYKNQLDKTTKRSKKSDQTEEEFEELKKLSNDYLEGWKRARADYENLERQTQQMKENWIKMANEELLVNILPVYDNLKLALSAAEKDEEGSKWLEGFKHIKSQFGKVLGEHGVEEIKTVGEQFDPQVHEVIDLNDSEDGGDKLADEGDMVIKKDIRPGYKLNGKLLYPAKVSLKKD